jgi:uncharacterized protein (DUF342 family)
MKEMREIDSELNQKNYERELKLCQKAGGDIGRYRRLSFDVFQLEQIRLGLEHGVDVESYLDPTLGWMEMESHRIALESGVDMTSYIQQGFVWSQCVEIRYGLQHGLDISKYADKKYFSLQMKEIRKGLSRGVDVSMYTDPDLDWMQMREIRRGLEKGVDVSQYANKEYKYSVMSAIRKALMEGQDIVPYAKKGYSGKVLMELSRGLSLGNDLSSFLEQGYHSEQLAQINNAYEAGVNILPYLSEEFNGPQLQEIVKGLKKELNVSIYAKKCYNWFQMRELRRGLESKIDVSLYENPDFSALQMAQIRKGIVDGLDVTEYAKIYYEPDQMEEMRKQLELSNAPMDSEIKEILSDARTKQKERKAEGEETSDNFLLDSCVAVSEDKMSATLCLAPVEGVYDNLQVADIIRILKHHEVKQGIHRNRIHALLKSKDYHSKIVVAEGKEAVDGADGKFVYYFRQDLKRKPKLLEDGSVDYKNMELFEEVKKGQLVAEYQPATTGSFGYDVTGQLCTPTRGKELPPLHGQGFNMSEDRKKYYSIMDGIIELDDMGGLEIRNVYNVLGDVDAATGNISFNGDVNIMGSVQPGFSVAATGNVAVDGMCEGSTIVAGKDIVLHKGCQGQGVGKLSAHGSITGKFFESVQIEAGGDVTASYLLNCRAKVQGKLLVEGRKGVILGGYVCAKQGINCYSIGNVAEIRTVVEVGVGKDDLTHYQEIMKELEKVESEIQTCETALEKFMAQPEHDEKIAGLCERLTKAIYTEKLKKKELLQEKDECTEEMTIQKAARIVISGSIYPGSHVYMNSEPFAVKEVRSNVQFVKQENKIDVFAR